MAAACKTKTGFRLQRICGGNRMSSRSKKTRDLLMQAAISLFAEKGYADTSIREIGTLAAVSPSVLYHYFKNKEQMLFEVITTSSENSSGR